mmetsp:Transcript_1126/g.1104  ORF Transcript_1126/g.1104 Transcript_1126/m.1104 type:complete len:90 (+) Transcript_1126:165-434(+)
MLFGEYPFQAPSNEYQILYRRIQNEEPYYPVDFEDKDAIDLLKQIFIKDPKLRITLKQIKTHSWVTASGKFPLADKEEQLSNDDSQVEA